MLFQDFSPSVFSSLYANAEFNWAKHVQQIAWDTLHEKPFREISVSWAASGSSMPRAAVSAWIYNSGLFPEMVWPRHRQLIPFYSWEILQIILTLVLWSHQEHTVPEAEHGWQSRCRTSGSCPYRPPAPPLQARWRWRWWGQQRCWQRKRERPQRRQCRRYTVQF